MALLQISRWVNSIKNFTQGEGPGDPKTKKQNNTFSSLARQNPTLTKSLGFEKNAEKASQDTPSYQLNNFSPFPKPGPLSTDLQNIINHGVLKDQVVNEIYQKIIPFIQGDLDTLFGIRNPEAVKETIAQCVLVSGTNRENMQVAILIPNDKGEVETIIETGMDKLKEFAIGKTKEKIEQTVKEISPKLIKLSQLTKNPEGKFVFKLLGKSMQFISKGIKIIDIAKTIIDGKESLERGKIPVFGDFIQSNPTSLQAPGKIEQRTISGLKKLFGIENTPKPKHPPFDGPHPITDHPEDNAAMRNFPKNLLPKN